MAITPAKIDISAAKGVRYDELKTIINDVFATTDATTPVKKRNFARWAFFYIMWHESALATTRKQSGGGPGRGLMQFEPQTVFDVLEQYVYGPTAGLVQGLADAAGVKRTIMDTALKAFRNDPNPRKNAWPTVGEAMKVEEWLSDNSKAKDSFGILLMRYQFRRYNEGVANGEHAFPGYPDYTDNPWDVQHKGKADVPTTDAEKKADKLTQVGHWALHWKKAGADKPKRQNFLDHAADLDAVKTPTN